MRYFIISFLIMMTINQAVAQTNENVNIIAIMPLTGPKNYECDGQEISLQNINKKILYSLRDKFMDNQNIKIINRAYLFDYDNSSNIKQDLSPNYIIAGSVEKHSSKIVIKYSIIDALSTNIILAGEHKPDACKTAIDNTIENISSDLNLLLEI